VKHSAGNPPPIFDGLINYQRWKTRLEDYLQGHNLWVAVTSDLSLGHSMGLSTSETSTKQDNEEIQRLMKKKEKLDEEAIDKNRLAKSMIRSFVSDSLLHYMVSLSAFKCMRTLDTAYNRQGTGS
jgi:hypothetical protein